MINICWLKFQQILKVVSAGRTCWYPREAAGKEANRRAERLPSEYERALRDLDVRFLGAAPARRGQPEPTPALSWPDLESSDLHQLLRLFAETRCANIGRAAGWEGAAEAILGKVMGEMRRAFSVVVVRSQAICLLERLAQLGPGARAAAQRRQVTLRLEE